MDKLETLLSELTVDSKDDGRNFTDRTRIDVITRLLREKPEYQLLQEGNLSLIYGKKPVRNSKVVLISSHIDCVFGKLFFQDYSAECYKGTFDNSITNACVIYDMLCSNLPDNVVIAFTGDEEEESGGAYEVMRAFRQWNTTISTAIVLDVTEEGWSEKKMFTVENDLGIDIEKGYEIINLLKTKYNGVYGTLHEAEPDEAWDYDEQEIPTFTLCLPIFGDMHSDAGVLARKESVKVYSEVLRDLAVLLSGI